MIFYRCSALLKGSEQGRERVRAIYLFCLVHILYLFYVEDNNELLCQVIHSILKNMLIWGSHFVSGQNLGITGRILFSNKLLQ